MPAAPTGPRFLGIGAQKAGTTWLYRNMSRHPGIWLPPVKELHYFDLFPQVLDLGHVAYLRRMLRGNHGFDDRWRRMGRAAVARHRNKLDMRTLGWDLRHQLGRPSDDWYRRLFATARGGEVPGEITPGYSALSRDDVEWVHDVVGDIQVLLFLRNPIERAWSHASMDLRRKGSSIDDATDDQVRSHFEGRANRNRTAYAEILDKWESVFGAERLFVGFLEDIALHPGRTLRRVYDFLGLGSDMPHRVIRTPVFTGRVGGMPRRFAVHLARMYLPDLERLDDRFGGYVTRWRQIAETLADDGPDLPETVSHPLWHPEPGSSGPLSRPLATTTRQPAPRPVPML